MRRGHLFSLVILVTLLTVAPAQVRFRKTIRIPDIPGYRTLKGDFHTHTVFSDGTVWPYIRAEEAFREGLDIVAITDHLEYQPHREDLPTNHNRSYEIAAPHGSALEVMVVKGSEVTRDMPPGHLNAVFIQDADPLDHPNWRTALNEAADQGAFIFWNHPGWSGQQSDGVAKWYAEHTELVENNLLHGIEVVNEREYYPEVHRWCLEKNLTMLANSDIHDPLNLDYRVHNGDPRPLTLVFAKEATPAAVREALFAGRTALYANDMLIGRPEFVRPIFENSVRVLNPEIELVGENASFVRIENQSDIDFELISGAGSGVGADSITLTEEVVLEGGGVSVLVIRSTREDLDEEMTFSVRFLAENVKVAPDVGMPVEFGLKVRFRPEPE